MILRKTGAFFKGLINYQMTQLMEDQAGNQRANHAGFGIVNMDIG